MIPIFKLEEYLTEYEFTAPYLLCCSDAESLSVQEIIGRASSDDRSLWDNLRLNYTEAYGLPLLREQIVASLYPSLKPENILCFAGAEEGIFACLHVLCEPQDHAIVLTPCYQSLLEVPRFKGAAVTTIALREENDWRIEVTEIARAIRPNTRCIVINFPHNPTGQVITQEELTALVTLCEQHGVWLFSDEAYRLLGNPTHPWAKPAAELYPKAFSLGVMSKAFGLAGLRIGWIACQDSKMLHKIKQMKDYLSICNSAPSEIISLIALKNKDSILQRNNRIITENMTLLSHFFDEYRDRFSWVQPQGGCVGYVKYKNAEPIDIFCKRVVDQSGVLLLPATAYNHQSQHFRLGFGRKNMPLALNQFKEFLR